MLQMGNSKNDSSFENIGDKIALIMSLRPERGASKTSRERKVLGERFHLGKVHFMPAF